MVFYITEWREYLTSSELKTQVFSLNQLCSECFFKRIPDKFVRQHLTKTESSLNSENATIVCPLRKFWRVKIDHGLTDVLHGDEWVQFVKVHDLSEGNILLFRYVGYMALSVEVFLRNGCLKEYNKTLALCVTDGARGPSATSPQSKAIFPGLNCFM
jgi:hypothetical protein